MRIRKIVLTCLLLTALLLPAIPAQGASGEFQIQWAIHLPRHTYFIGETINFTATATSSLDPRLKIPNEYANVQILNETHFDIFDWQAMTDPNGTASFFWNASVDQEPGNYSIVLRDGYGNTVADNFTLIFDQDTYNQGRLDQLQRQIDARDQYMNILFARDFWLVNQVQAFWKMLYWTLGMTLVTFLMVLTLFMADKARDAMLSENRKKRFTFGLKALGISATPPSRMTDKQPELARIVIPANKVPPRYGMTEFCDECDPDHKIPMTKARLKEHRILHEKRWLGIDGSWRKRAAKRVVRAAYPEPKKEHIFEQDKPENKLRAKLITKTIEIGEKVEKNEDVTTEVIELREMIAKPSQVLKQTPSAKPVNPRKVRVEKQHSDAPKARLASPSLTKAERDIELLWKDLNHGKVN